MEPASCIVFAHIQNFHQSRDNELAIERKRTTHFQPGFSFLFLKNSAEFLRLSLLVNITLHHGDFQVFTVKSQMMIEHFCENTKDSRLVFIAESFDVDIKQNGLCRSFGGMINQQKGCRIIFKFFTETLCTADTFYFFIFQKIRKHFQEMRFTTSKKTGDPHTHIGCGLIKGIPVITEKCNKMFFQFSGDDVFI